MRVTLVVDGRPETVDVDLGTSTVTRGGVPLPFKVVSSGGKVELEVAGERLVVDGWPAGLPEPPESVSVNGETVRIELTGRSGTQLPESTRVPSTDGGPVARPAETRSSPAIVRA